MTYTYTTHKRRKIHMEYLFYFICFVLFCFDRKTMEKFWSWLLTSCNTVSLYVLTFISRKKKVFSYPFSTWIKWIFVPYRSLSSHIFFKPSVSFDDRSIKINEMFIDNNNCKTYSTHDINSICWIMSFHFLFREWNELYSWWRQCWHYNYLIPKK